MSFFQKLQSRLRSKKGDINIFTMLVVLCFCYIIFSLIPWSVTAINMRMIKSTTNKTLETVMTNNMKSFAYNEYKLSVQNEYSEKQTLSVLKSFVNDVNDSLYYNGVTYDTNTDSDEQQAFGDSVITEICHALNATTDRESGQWIVNKNSIVRYNNSNPEEVVFEIQTLRINEKFMSSVSALKTLKDIEDSDYLSKYVTYENGLLTKVTVPLEYTLIYHNKLPLYSNDFKRVITDEITFSYASAPVSNEYY